MTDEVKLPELDVKIHEIRRAETMSQSEWEKRWDNRIPVEVVAEQLCRERQLLAALRENATLQEKLARRESNLDRLTEANAVLLRRAEDAEAELSKADGWVDVEERMPDHHDMVLVWYVPTFSDGMGKDFSKKGFWGGAFRSRSNDPVWLRSDGNRANGVFGTITHWHPVAPPSPDTEASK